MQDLTVITLDDATLHELAAEIVRDIYPIETILKRFNLTFDTLNRLKQHKRFILMLAEAAITWDSSLNTRQRLKIKGDVIVEQMMLKAFQYYNDERQPLAARAKLLETVAKISGAYEEGTRTPTVLSGGDVGRPSDRVQITINLHPRAQPGDAAIVIDQQKLNLPPNDPLTTPGSER